MTSITTRNPYSGHPLDTYPVASIEEINQRLDQSWKTYHDWSSSSLNHRLEVIRSVRDGLEQNLEGHAALITSEMGKPIRESRSELQKCLWLFDHFLDEAEEMLTPVIQQLDGLRVMHLLEPTGAVFGIMPWNFPYWQVMRFAIPTLLLGNIVILKHSPITTGCGLAIQDLFEKEANGIFQTFVLDIPQVEMVIAHDLVQGACLTGSTGAGRRVAALAGKYLKKSVLELGGTDAFVLLEDADLASGIEAAFLSRTLNAGQSCIAAKRIFVPRPQVNQAVEVLISRISQVVQGDPSDQSTTMGPLASEEFAVSLLEQQNRLIQAGGKLIHEGLYNGAMVAPQLIVSEAHNPVNQEELFGPVLNVIPWDDEKNLLKAVNDTPYGLGGAVWSCDEEKAVNFAQKIETGAVAINAMMKSDPRVPFGGIRQSGYGREMGIEGLKSFANLKVIMT